MAIEASRSQGNPWGGVKNASSATPCAPLERWIEGGQPAEKIAAQDAHKKRRVPRRLVNVSLAFEQFGVGLSASLRGVEDCGVAEAVA